eukprot:CAMPEP_0198289372 /NCGR_PEP_ID=MMETSP1449-20131203/7569_1 /TAXON_ID=420275 /ORGANISM="Attheya septentrionalis, Strain CCMP2084" /LENGTH=930 /DNA_ID=CAMNT_0043987681 /DNA_START=135 /DNA_END=2924 /DNA_ORIENTATION=+
MKVSGLSLALWVANNAGLSTAFVGSFQQQGFAVVSPARRMQILGPQHSMRQRIPECSSRLHLSTIMKESMVDDTSSAHPLQIDDLDVFDNNGGINIAEMTQILLDKGRNPPGSLSADVVNLIHPVLCAWAKTASIKGALMVEELIRRMEEEIAAGNGNAFLTTRQYIVGLDAWARSGDANAGVRAQMILDNMTFLYSSGTNVDVKPDAIAYSALINSWKQSDAPERAEEVLVKMNSLIDGGETDLIPNRTNCFNAVIAAYARQGNALKAEEILKQMIEISESDESCQPVAITYNSIIDAWAKSGEKRLAAERAEEILYSMQDRYEGGEDHLKPDEFSYSGVALAWARSEEPDSAERAKALLEQMEKFGVQPDIYCYNAVLAARGKNNDEETAIFAEELLDDMVRSGTANRVSFTVVLNAWKNCDSKKSLERSKRIVSRMEDIYRDDPTTDVKPDVFTYTVLIDLYAKSKEIGTVDKVEELLEHMFLLSDEGDKSAAPNTVTINSVIDCFAKCGEKGAAERAEQLLSRMEQMYETTNNVSIRPNTISYTSVMDAYAKSTDKESVKKAGQIFSRMQTAFEAGNLNAKPNLHSFNTAINVYVQSGDADSAKQAESTLHRMEDLYKDGNSDIKPNVISYTSVMQGWVKSSERDAPLRAEAVFDRMVEMYKGGNESAKPNMHTYSTLISAFLKSSKQGSVQRAEDILRKMRQSFEDGTHDIKPNTILITSVCDAWAKSGEKLSGKKALALLDWMTEICDKDKDDHARPNAVTFTAVINGWAKSHQFGKAVQAKAVLERMVSAYEGGNEDARPNVFAYTGVLNACAYTIGDLPDKRDALQIASSTYKELCASNYGDPNHVTYGTFLQVCTNLIPQGPSRASSVVTVFKKCIEDGQVNRLVIAQLEKALTSDELKSILPTAVSENGTVDLSKLPAEW